MLVQEGVSKRKNALGATEAVVASLLHGIGIMFWAIGTDYHVS